MNDAAGHSKSLGTMRDNIIIDPIQGVYCPLDEFPEAVASSNAKWLHNTRTDRLDLATTTSLKNLETSSASSLADFRLALYQKVSMNLIATPWFSQIEQAIKTRQAGSKSLAERR